MNVQAARLVDVIANGGKNVTASNDHRSATWVERGRGRNRIMEERRSAGKRRGLSFRSQEREF